MTLVSIVIDNYNYGCYLAEAIDSALAQAASGVPVEVIVVDDGSTDDSRAVIARYGERVIPIFKANGGQASAFNAGFARARGDAIVFLDADDVLLSGACARALAELERDATIAKVMAPMLVIDDAGRETGARLPEPGRAFHTGDLHARTLMHAFDGVWAATSGNLFARWALERVLPLPEARFRIAADLPLVHLAALQGRVVALDTPGALYRIHGSNEYADASGAINLRRIRMAALHAWHTEAMLFAAAPRTAGSPVPGSLRDVRSVASVANRLISLRLGPVDHPVPGDRSWILLCEGWSAARRRHDVSRFGRLVFAGWFAALAIAPRPLAAWLARAFVAPETLPGWLRPSRPSRAR